MRLLGLEFKSDNMIKSKAMKLLLKYIVKDSNVWKTKQNRLMPLSNCAICGKKKPTFIKNQELHNFYNTWNN